MKQAPTNPEAIRRDRRERLRRERSAAQPLRVAYPQIARLRLQLNFRDGSALPPAAQSHILHPPAPAFFRFPCPFSDCDGQFDLGAPVAEIASKAGRQASHGVTCQGVRARDRLTGHQCGLKLDYTISLSYLRDIAA
ncbi:MAG: hypothetical protein ACRETT_09550 [Steroidobacteraceae bacterium]